ncbi:MAG TPA: LuxR C-terminal-related transcriptional regulator [Solirubrobacterales bacterium]|nr:LuxR C-terminal-related transcriptional regulator [Solirubrobacterales bacterium]
MRRDRLTEHLDGADTPVLMLVAPAGYGKSTALADWTAQDERPSAWLTLDERHNDPAVLLYAIASLLDDIEPIGEEVFAPLSTPRSGVSSAVVPRLRNALHDRHRPFILVFDDLHLVENPDCVAPLVAVIQSVPPGSQVAIASRSTPPWPFGRMRANRLLTELSASELEMSVGEAAQTLAACGLDLNRDAVEMLVERTEGWPVGLYLAGLSLTQKSGVDVAIADFHGDDRLVADYVRDEFFAALDEDTLSFLVGTSILDRLSGEVCDAVLERNDSGEMLRRLARSNLLIVPLDHRDRAYRHHALFKEMLSAELGRLGVSESSGLHTRASEWFREQGDAERAVSHAIDAGDRDLAADLIWTNAPAFVSTGRHATVRAWLDEFTVEQLATSPALCVARATRHLAEGNGGAVERWTGMALDRLDGSGAADEATIAAARIIRAAGAAHDGVVKMREDIQPGIELLPSDSPWRPLCLLVDGASRHLCRELDEARETLEDAARQAFSTPSVETLCRAQLALVAIDDGDMGEAERQTDLAMMRVEHFGLGDHPTQALVFAVSALVRARRGRSEAATFDAKAAVRLQGGLKEMSSWYETETHITVARALLQLDDAVAARVHLAAAGRHLRKASDAVLLQDWLADAWAEVDTAGSVGGRWPLTPAELKLLHMLPTHFSFRQIAERSFVSQNTVKTQAQSVYRKLGVSSRAEAVACARAAGLLDPEAEDSPMRGDAPSIDGA